MKSVLVVDYGMGNLFSVRGALEKAGGETETSSDPDLAARAERLVLPGVGSFGDGMRNLDERGLGDAIREAARKGTPILGICLGAHLLTREGSEGGRHAGLGLLPAVVRRLEPEGDLRLPHIGWNDVAISRGGRLFEGMGRESLFYFVHSYHIVPDDPRLITATTEYGGEVTAAVEMENLFAVQFHPEKSQREGLRLLENFLERT